MRRQTHWLVGVIVIACANLDGSAYAQDNFEAQQKALDSIADFAAKICASPPLDGNGTELTAEGKAELSGIVSKVAGLGVDGAVKYQSKEYQGVLQEDLATSLQHASDCKLKVFESLKDKLISMTLPQKTETCSIRVKTDPPHPNQLSGATLSLYVDDELVDEVGNVPKASSFEVGKLARGAHTFRFEDIQGYFMDGFGNFQPVPQMSGLECDGDFAVTQSKTFRIIAYVDPAGNLTCALQ